MIARIAMVILVSLATGCSVSPYGSAASGGANYTYLKTSDGSCHITINSARDIAGGSMSIGEDCSVSILTQSAGGGQVADIVDKLGNAIK